MDVDAAVDTSVLGEGDRLDRCLAGECKAAKRCAVNAKTVCGLGFGVEEALEVLLVLDGLRVLNWIARASALSVPALVFHGTADTSSPPVVARLLAQLRPDMVQLEMFLAEHTLGWNSDPKRWARLASEWLAAMRAE